ncbi:MAG: AsmA family protein [Verrucomicrobiales bacterium]|nr:AsmA family protein [Verrucomicrobiales bacterium]
MNRLARRLLLVLALLGFLLVLVLAGATWWLRSLVTKEALVQQIEEACNTKAEIDDVDFSLFSSPAHLTLTNVRLSAIDAPPEAAPTPITIGQADLQISLMSLLSKQVLIHQLILRNLDVKEYISPEGVSTLQALFKKSAKDKSSSDSSSVASKPKSASAGKPAAPDPKATPALPDAPPLGSHVAAGKSNAADNHPATFHADALGLAIIVKEAGIENGTFFVHNRASSTKPKTRIDGLHFLLTNIDVDPANLAAHNRVSISLEAHITVEARAKLDGDMQDVQFADLHLRGSGDVAPFDPATKELRPNSLMSVVLAKDSVVAGHMKLGQADAKSLQKREKYGLNLGELPIGGPLTEDLNLRMQIEDGRMTILENVVLGLPEYQIRVEGGSWLNPSADLHELHLQLVCGPTLEGILVEGMKQHATENLVEPIRKALQNDDGHMAFDLISYGPLSRPRYLPGYERPLDKLLNEHADELIEGLLKSK